MRDEERMAKKEAERTMRLNGAGNLGVGRTGGEPEIWDGIIGCYVVPTD
jgi:hypothetical protein